MMICWCSGVKVHLYVISAPRIEAVAFDPMARLATADTRALAIATVGTPDPLVAVFADDPEVTPFVAPGSEATDALFANLDISIDVLTPVQDLELQRVLLQRSVLANLVCSSVLAVGRDREHNARRILSFP